VADFNGDGNTDLLPPTLNTNDPPGLDSAGRWELVASAQSSPASLSEVSATFQPNMVVAADVNGDGTPDILTLGSATAGPGFAVSVRLNCRQNAAPVIGALGAQTVVEDSTLTLSAVNSTASTVSDTDAG